MFFIRNIEKYNFEEASSFHNKSFKTPVAVKEMINIKDAMYKIITLKYRKTSSNLGG